jgi:conjugal transfer pilus assembly protein TraV
LFTACGPKFSCKNTISGTSCESLTEVYEHRHDVKKDKQDEIKKKKDVPSPAVPDKNGKKIEKVEPSVSEEVDIVRKLAYSENKPIRVPPKVIRIWISPWEDADGDLHQPELIFSEISDKRGRWLFGEKETAVLQPTFFPLDRATSTQPEPQIQSTKGQQVKPAEIKKNAQ